MICRFRLDTHTRSLSTRSRAPIPLLAKASMACPPTLDHAWLLANLENLDAGIIGDKTNIAAPITSAVQRLKDSDARRKIIVLFTDGSNNVEAKVTPLQAAKLANTFDITVYTVGIGSPGMSNISTSR